MNEYHVSQVLVDVSLCVYPWLYTFYLLKGFLLQELNCMWGISERWACISCPIFPKSLCDTDLWIHTEYKEWCAKLRWVISCLIKYIIHLFCFSGAHLCPFATTRLIRIRWLLPCYIPELVLLSVVWELRLWLKTPRSSLSHANRSLLHGNEIDLEWV